MTELRVVHVQARDNAIVNRLNKTKIEKEVDHESDRQDRLRLEGRKKKVEVLERVCRVLSPCLESPYFPFPTPWLPLFQFVAHATLLTDTTPSQQASRD